MSGMDEQVKWPVFSLALSAILQSRGVTTYQIEKDTGLRASNLSPILKGTKRPSDNVIRTLSEYKPLGLSYTVLFKWRLSDEDPRALGLDDDPDFDSLIAQSDKHHKLRNVVTLDQFKGVPIVGKVSAGKLHYISQEAEGYIPWPPNKAIPEECVGLRVSGDSMAPTYPDGTYLYVAPCDKVTDGKAHVVEVDDEATVKVVRLGQDELTLEPLNPEHKRFKVKMSDIRKCWRVLASLKWE